MRYFGNVNTVEQLKEYFDVSVYRNILDMLNTLQGQAKDVGDAVAGIAVKTIGQDMKHFQGKGTKGAAIKAVGKSAGDGGNETYYWWAKKTARDAGLSPASVPKVRLQMNDSRAPLIGISDVRIYDLLNLGRSIDWEMNRVRLPVPHNFRQFLSKMQNMPLTIGITMRGARAGGPLVSDASAINFIEAMERFGQLLDAVKAMREAVRKEIDAAALARQVEEETLRREQEELISREQAAKEAAAREAAIRAEKAIAYKADYDALIQRLKVATTREEQDMLLTQIATVVKAINSLQVDSVGYVAVPEVALLPTAAELQQVAQQVAEQTAQRQQEIAKQIEQEVAAHDQLVDAANSATSNQEAAELARQVQHQAALIRSLESQLEKTAARLNTAETAKQAAQAGDVETAAANLNQATKKPINPLVPVGVILSLLLTS